MFFVFLQASGQKGVAFQRVKAEEWLGKKGSWDNSYQATFGSEGWGAGAQAKLGQVWTPLVSLRKHWQ